MVLFRSLASVFFVGMFVGMYEVSNKKLQKYQQRGLQKMPLTDTSVRNLKPGIKTAKHSDGGGLYVQVTPQGSKLWRMAYRFGGRQKTLSFGKYPEISLLDARKRRDEAKTQLANRMDPSELVRRDKQERKIAAGNTFGEIADEFLAKQSKEGLAQVTLDKKRWYLSLSANKLNHRVITEITARDILEPLKLIENRGIYETANRVRSTIGQVFRYAISTARAENDPTYGLRGALITPIAKHQAALVGRNEFGNLIKSIWEYHGSPETNAGLKLLALLYPRPGELRQAKWHEFDLDAGIWSIPKERMKMRVSHKKPLSFLAINILEELRTVTGFREFAFPSYQSPLKPMSENTLNMALRRLGYKKEQATSHGFRASASSLLNESGLWSADAIEAEQSRKDRNAVRGIYNRSQYWDERVKMAEWWAKQIETMRTL